jgi:hypothetical protein
MCPKIRVVQQAYDDLRIQVAGMLTCMLTFVTGYYRLLLVQDFQDFLKRTRKTVTRTRTYYQ